MLALREAYLTNLGRIQHQKLRLGASMKVRLSVPYSDLSVWIRERTGLVMLGMAPSCETRLKVLAYRFSLHGRLSLTSRQDTSVHLLFQAVLQDAQQPHCGKPF